MIATRKRNRHEEKSPNKPVAYMRTSATSKSPIARKLTFGDDNDSDSSPFEHRDMIPSVSDLEYEIATLQSSGENFPNYPKFVNLFEMKQEWRVPYKRLWRSDTINGWPANKYLSYKNKKGKMRGLTKSQLEDITTKYHWDRNGFHRSTSRLEGNLLAIAVECINVYMSVDENGRPLKMSNFWWKKYTEAWLKVAAYRDYHDYRMAISQKSYKTLSKYFLEKLSPNMFRDYKHFFRIWNCIVFPREFRIMLEGGCSDIPRSVVKLLVEGRNMKYVDKKNLLASLKKIKTNNPSRPHSRSVGDLVGSSACVSSRM